MNPPMDDKRAKLLDFIMNQPLHDDCVSMDCTDDCETISRLAERVAAGERLEDIAPNFEQFVGRWSDCREEFHALVAILRAELAQQNGRE